MSATAVSPNNFYGPPSIKELKIAKILKTAGESRLPQLPQYLSTLLGPSRTWLAFKKQADAVECAKQRGCGLMSFAYETSSGVRCFLTCHPIMLWFVNQHRPVKDRCTYEIIPESAPCKLYFDIEFEYEHNRNSNGTQMIKTFLKIIFWNLKNYFDLDVSANCVLDLDSCTDQKFSHHLIFQLPDTAFKDNFMVGNFVKKICKEVEDTTQDIILLEDLSVRYNMSHAEILEIIVADRKDEKKCFIDCGVYTRNRHFRLLGCTKLHKNAPLVISKSNQYQPSTNEDYSYFLASLVTYFDGVTKNVLAFGSPPCARNVSECTPVKREMSPVVSCTDLDDFINQVISPHGRIRQRTRVGNEINYDVTGYRYCHRIGRAHRSNNVRFIVDLDRFTFSQACYDPDCRGYLSPPVLLPTNLAFSSQDDSFLHEVADNLLADDDLLLILYGEDDHNFSYQHLMGSEFLNDGNEEVLLELSEECWHNVEGRNSTGGAEVPDMDLSDADLLNAEKCLQYDEEMPH